MLYVLICKYRPTSEKWEAAPTVYSDHSKAQSAKKTFESKGLIVLIVSFDENENCH